MNRDLLVRGGTVVDGTGSAAFAADVRARDGVIVEVGPGLAPDGERVVDAGGAYVTPGFLDTHTHLDPTLFWDRDCDPLPLHGVTTALVGNCSLSLAPIRPEHRAGLIGIFGYVEDLDQHMLATELPWTWETQGELQAALAGGLGINASFLVGHTPLRLYVMGDEAWDRPARDDEIVEMARVLDESLRAGAQGMSTSFYDTDAEGRMVPSAVADDRELEALVDVLARWGRIMEFIPNLRLADFRHDIERVAAVVGPRKVKATWNGLFHWDDRPDFAPGVLRHAVELQERGVEIFPQISPRRLDSRVNWNGSMILMRMRDTWNRYALADDDGKRSMLTDPDWRARARVEWDQATADGSFITGSPDRVRLASAVGPEDQRWLGRSLAELHAAESGHLSDVFADWALRNGLRPEIELVGVANNEPETIVAQFESPAAIISNSDAGAHLQTLCAHGDTTLVLTEFVRDRGDLTLERAIFELTGRQADVFGFADRGRVQVGQAADLTVFALDELDYAAEERAPDLPGGLWRMRRPWGGYRSTIVGGGVIQEGGKYTDERTGVVLGA